MTDWWALAACKGQDTELFFPYKETSGQAARAKAFCAGCEVTTQCLDFAMDTEASDGIFGGLTAIERKLLRSGEYAPDYGAIGHRDSPGTTAGYYREKTAGLRPCLLCVAAFNAYARAAQARYRKAKASA
jgi:WhiB family transcriptional regulator, redox-sensing transcriptional regulator